MKVLLVNKTQIALVGETAEILAAFERLTQGLQVDIVHQTETLMELDVSESQARHGTIEDATLRVLRGALFVHRKRPPANAEGLKNSKRKAL